MAQSGIEARRKAARAEGGKAYTSRRQEIVKVAAEVFREKGYDAATLNDIAEKLDTDRASLYYYVGSKEELLHEIVREVIHENVATAERVAKSEGTCRDKIEALIYEMMTSFERNYPAMYVYVEDLARISREDSEWARDVIKATRRFEAIVVDILKRGQASGHFRCDLPTDISALALFGMVNWTHQWYQPGARRDARKIATTFASVFLEGFKANGSGGPSR